MLLLQRPILAAAFAVCVLQLLTCCGRDNPDLPVPSTDHVYVYGEKISFGFGGDSHRFTTTGWSDPEPSGIWTDGPAASLVFRLTAPGGALRLSAKLSPNIKPPQLEAQLIHVYVQGQKVLTWRVAGDGQFTALIPPQLVGRGGLVHIDFHIPGAVSPLELGNGSDLRRLGVRCSEITLAQSQAKGGVAYQLGSPVQFSEGGNGQQYEVSGWSNPEKEFTWTEGTSATLQLPVHAKGPLTLRARMRGISRSEESPSQPTDVIVNGEKVAHWDVGGPAQFEAVIPESLVSGSESLLIEFRTPMAVSPSQLGGSNDKRVLGLCVFEMQLTGD